MSATAAARPSKLQAWRAAARPPTLTAAVAPVLVGTGLAIRDDAFDGGPALAALVGALCIQVGANFANDVFDYERGADTADRLGPPRATATGMLSPREVKTGMWMVFGLAALAGVYLAIVGGWPIVAVGVASIAAAIIYTGGPWPIGYHALGDLFTFAFFGLAAVGGTYYVQAGELTWPALAAAIPAGCTVTAILVVNNLRDIPTDRATGKRTLAVVMGDGMTRAWFGMLVVVAYVVAFVLWAAGEASPWVLLTVPAAAAGWPAFRAVFRGVQGAPLNAALKATARFHLAFGAALALALALS
ncbi:MAG: 1,4-dihydroxy-2-naphthoate polyprenyltransferase [Dehalococcoidia bacterium]